ncbi:MAG: hypothetical protein Q4E75_01770 [bacterium]|nr:hypothetical protein [bacterium]
MNIKDFQVLIDGCSSKVEVLQLLQLLEIEKLGNLTNEANYISQKQLLMIKFKALISSNSDLNNLEPIQKEYHK